MEIDQFLYKAQGVFKNEQTTLGELSILGKENEEGISKVVEALEKALEDIDLNKKNKQKLYVLLFLNCDIEVYNELKRSRKLAHLVGFFPKISKDLFMKIVLSLKLHQYVYESTAFFPSLLIYHLLDMCLSALKWLDLFEAIKFVKSLLFSLFCKIINSDEMDSCNAHLKDSFQRLLLFFDAEKSVSVNRMKSWKSAKLKHYGGLVMASLLSLLEKCTTVYCDKGTIITSNDCSLYDIKIDSTTNIVPASVIQNSSMSVQQCYEHVVAKCHENIRSITVDLWLYWVEIDLDDIPDTDNTLQRLVGERAFTCRESLKQAAQEFGVSSKEASDLMNRLQNIALKPHTEEDQAKSLGLDDLLKNIQDPNKDAKKWIRFLLSNPLFAVDTKSLGVIKIHISSLPSKDLWVLSKHIFNHLKTNKNCPDHKSFILEMVKLVDAESQVKIAECFVQEFGVSDILKTEEFQPAFVELFNKVVHEEDKEKELYLEFVSLALQDAKAVVSQAVAAGITSEGRGHLISEMLGRLQPFCDAQQPNGSSLLITTLDQLLHNLPKVPDRQRVNYPLFVRELVMRKVLKGEHYVTECILDNIDNHLRNNSWTVVSSCLETISELFDVDCTPPCLDTIAVLVMVLQDARWTPPSFNMAAVQVCELSQQLINQFVTKWFDIGIEDRSLTNMLALVQQEVRPLDRYHLSRMLPEERLPVDDPALQLVYRMHFGIGEWSVLQVDDIPEERLRLVYSLCFVLPVLTSSEWSDLFCVTAPKCSEFLCLYNIVTDSLLLCLESARMKNDHAVMSCLKLAIGNVAEAVKYEVVRWNHTDHEYRIRVLIRMCQLVSGLAVEQQEDLGTSLMKVLIQLLPVGNRHNPLTEEEMNKVTAAISSLQARGTRHALAKEFLEMVHR